MTLRLPRCSARSSTLSSLRMRFSSTSASSRRRPSRSTTLASMVRRPSSLNASNRCRPASRTLSGVTVMGFRRPSDEMLSASSATFAMSSGRSLSFTTTSSLRIRMVGRSVE